jgi:large subunit ribosomal protein L21
MYAVVKVGGHQEKVEKDDLIVANRLNVPNGEKVELEVVVAVNDKGDLIADKKALDNSRVIAEVIDDAEKGKKISIMRFRNKTRQIKRHGHRQKLTRLRVIDIELDKAPKKAKASSTKA